MTSRAEDRVRRVKATLAKHGAAIVPAGSRHVALASTGATPAPIDARLDAEWLTLCAPLPESVRTRSPWQLLGCNSWLPPTVYLTLARHDRRPYLRADLPVFAHDHDDDVLLEQRASQACDAIAVALASLTADSREARPTRHAVDTSGRAAGETPSLASVCDELGWPNTRQTAGDVAITLEVPRRFVKATLSAGHADTVRLEAELLRQTALSTSSREAIALFLLSTCDVTRLARPSATADADHVDVQLDVSWSGVPTPAELRAGVEALSVACRIVAREVDALCENSLAHQYLLLRADARAAGRAA